MPTILCTVCNRAQLNESIHYRAKVQGQVQHVFVFNETVLFFVWDAWTSLFLQKLAKFPSFCPMDHFKRLGYHFVACKNLYLGQISSLVLILLHGSVYSAKKRHWYYKYAKLRHIRSLALSLSLSPLLCLSLFFLTHRFYFTELLFYNAYPET